MQRTIIVTLLAVAALALPACGGSDEPEAATTTSTTAAEPEDVTEPAEEPAREDPAPPEPSEEPDVEFVECSELEGAVNLAVQSVGCTVDGARAPVSALPCEDGRTVLIAGDRYGIEGETWQPYDLATDPPATELC